MTSLALLDSTALRQLAQQGAANRTACACTQTDTSAWVSIPLSFPQEQLDDVATLVADPFVEATFTEFHPAGTRNDSPEAPVAPQHYPYNRCQVARCRQCGRHYLRYTEAGGYFVDYRIRALLRPDLVTDA